MRVEYWKNGKLYRVEEIPGEETPETEQEALETLENLRRGRPVEDLSSLVLLLATKLGL